MKITTVKTKPVTPKLCSMYELLDEFVTELHEKTVVVVTSKVVSLCEGRVVPVGEVMKDELVHQEAAYYLPSSSNPYNVTISITRGNLVASGGVDESNSNEHYVLWPENLQASANGIREHLMKRHGVKELGVIITDSASRPFQRGTTGIGIAYSGLEPLHSYVGTEDIFGRKMHSQNSNIVNGLAAAAVVAMGEGAEQTPIAIIEDTPFVTFVDRNPTEVELEALQVTLTSDLFAPVLQNVPWQKGLGK